MTKKGKFILLMVTISLGLGYWYIGHYRSKVLLAESKSDNGKYEVRIYRVNPKLLMQSPYEHVIMIKDLEQDKEIKNEVFHDYDSEIGERNYEMTWMYNKLKVVGIDRNDEYSFDF